MFGTQHHVLAAGPLLTSAFYFTSQSAYITHVKLNLWRHDNEAYEFTYIRLSCLRIPAIRDFHESGGVLNMTRLRIYQWLHIKVFYSALSWLLTGLILTTHWTVSICSFWIPSTRFTHNNRNLSKHLMELHSVLTRPLWLANPSLSGSTPGFYHGYGYLLITMDYFSLFGAVDFAYWAASFHAIYYWV